MTVELVTYAFDGRVGIVSLSRLQKLSACLKAPRGDEREQPARQGQHADAVETCAPPAMRPTSFSATYWECDWTTP